MQKNVMENFACAKTLNFTEGSALVDNKHNNFKS